MYQSVDDIEENDGKSAGKEVGRLKLIAALLVGLAILAAVAIFSSGQKPDIDPQKIASAEQYEIYFKALGEPKPALRRARLLDFIQNYPDHERGRAAQAQLDVIQQADDLDWFSLQEIIFDPGQSKPAKLAALDLYEDMWGSMLLGGREDEVAELREQFETTTEPESETPENPIDFTPEPDQFSEEISGTKLAGEVVVVERTYIPPAPISRPAPQPRAQTKIVKPKVRKERRPRYPKRALRRNIEAEVVLALNIDEKGEVQMTEVVSVRASKYRKDFIKAAERAALRSKYFPQTLNGRPVATSGYLRKFVFEIRD